MQKSTILMENQPGYPFLSKSRPPDSENPNADKCGPNVSAKQICDCLLNTPSDDPWKTKTAPRPFGPSYGAPTTRSLKPSRFKSPTAERDEPNRQSAFRLPLNFVTLLWTNSFYKNDQQKYISSYNSNLYKKRIIHQFVIQNDVWSSKNLLNHNYRQTHESTKHQSYANATIKLKIRMNYKIHKYVETF